MGKVERLDCDACEITIVGEPAITTRVISSVSLSADRFAPVISELFYCSTHDAIAIEAVVAEYYLRLSLALEELFTDEFNRLQNDIKNLPPAEVEGELP